MKKATKISLISLGSLLGVIILTVCILLWFVLTPSKLTPLVQRLSSEYLHADVKLEKVDVTLFSTFPRLALRIDNGRITAPDSDSLLSFKKCRVVFSPFAYLKDNRLMIHRILLDSADIYAYRNSEGYAYWDSLTGSDTLENTGSSQGGPESIVVKSLRIRNTNITFDDRSTRTFARVKGLDTRLKFGIGEKGILAGLQLACKDVLFWQQGDLLVRRTALTLNTKVGYKADSMKVVLRDADLTINDVSFKMNGTLLRDTVRRTSDVDLKIEAAAPSVEKILHLIPESVVKHTDLTATGRVVMDGTIRGSYGNGLLPVITLCLQVDSATAHYEGLPYGIDNLTADFDAFVDLMREQESYFDLKILRLQGNDIDVLADAKVTEIFDDPLITMNARANVGMESLMQTLPFQESISLKGWLDADLKLRTRLSNIMNQDFGRIFAAGSLQMDSLAVKDLSSGLNAAGHLQMKFFGGKALGAKGEISNLKVESPWIEAIADSLHFRVISTRPADTTKRFRVRGEFSMNRLGAAKGDSLRLFCGRGTMTAALRPQESRPELPEITLNLQTDTLFARYADIRSGLAKGVIAFKAEKLRDSLWKPSIQADFSRLRASMADTLRAACLKGRIEASLHPRVNEGDKPKAELSIITDSIFGRAGEIKGFLKRADIALEAERIKDTTWMPAGEIGFKALQLELPQCSLPVKVSSTVITMGNRKINLKKAAVSLGRSQVVLSGTVYDLHGTLTRGRKLRADMNLFSPSINMNQILRAFSSSETVETTESADTLSAPLKLFQIPDKLDFRFTTDISRLRFGKYLFKDIRGRAELRDSHVYLENLSLKAFDNTTLDASLIYKAATAKYGYAGFDLKINDIDIEKLIQATPAIDTLLPMLQSFKGKVQMNVAAESVLDSLLNLEIPSLRSAVYIRGDSLVLMDGQTFAEISKKLMFKNKEENLIDSISVNLTVEDGSVNVYPFLVEIDRYKAAIGGVQNLDMSFDYHISILKSPLPFKAGLNIRGTLDDMRFGIGKAKYKDAVTPVETMRIDTIRINLSEEITRRFKSEAERRKWSQRADMRARINWNERKDSARRRMRVVFDGDSITWEKMATPVMFTDSTAKAAGAAPAAAAKPAAATVSSAASSERKDNGGVTKYR